jgi:hypothetical protein
LGFACGTGATGCGAGEEEEWLDEPPELDEPPDEWPEEDPDPLPPLLLGGEEGADATADGPDEEGVGG